MQKRGVISLGVTLILLVSAILLSGCSGTAEFDITNTAICMENGRITRICSTASGCLQACKVQVCPKEDLAFESSEFSNDYENRKCICHCKEP
ncbi:hypothetical protein JXB02_02620 [Candidatus Woesearchaeota archaeon]|nr:hypothetical protein [Candidatus Woesearchaeota archaeon]